MCRQVKQADSTSCDMDCKQRSTLQVVCGVVAKGLIGIVGLSAFLAAFYTLLTRGPLYLIYDGLEHAGPGSVYVPGGAFSGFWFQLGMLHSTPSLYDHNYYCYSSGCLSVLVAFMKMSLDDIYQSAYDVQDAWFQGDISMHDIVDHFVDDILQSGNMTMEHVPLDQLKVLVTTSDRGVVAKTATSLDELKELMIQTTYIPLLTGSSFWPKDGNGAMYLDGGFSQLLHPQCEHDLSVPNTAELWMYAFVPTFGQSMVQKFWSDGHIFGSPLK